MEPVIEEQKNYFVNTRGSGRKCEISSESQIMLFNECQYPVFRSPLVSVLVHFTSVWELESYLDQQQ